MMAAALPVDEDAVDVEAIVQRMKQGLPPADVQEYLWRVRIEAEGIPDVVVSNVDPRQYDPKQTPNMPALDELCEVSDAGLLPGDEWKSEILADFAELRQQIARWQELGAPPRDRGKEAKPPSAMLRMQVPRMNDEDAWRVFFFGKCSERNAINDNGESIDALTFDVADADVGTPPHLRLLLQFDQVLTRRLLVYQTEWLENIESVSRARGVWIYALLARLDKPVHAEVAATIRQLLRRCWRLRNKLSVESVDKLKTLNILICITGDFFGQLEAFHS